MWKHICWALFQAFGLGWCTLGVFLAKDGWLMLFLTALNAWYLVDYVEKAHKAWREEK
jgi:hypothetical protein